jgi:hypothetical protein
MGFLAACCENPAQQRPAAYAPGRSVLGRWEAFDDFVSFLGTGSFPTP